MTEKNENNKDSQTGQVTPKKIFKKTIEVIDMILNDSLMEDDAY